MPQSISHSPILAITFDAAGTLIHLAEPVGVSYARIAAEHGIESNPDNLGKAFGSVWKRTPLPFSPQSRVTDPDEKSWWRRLVRAVFEDAGAELPGESVFSDFFESLYTHFESPGTWISDPEATTVLEKVRGNYSCLVISNFDARLRRILDDLGLLQPLSHVGEHEDGHANSSTRRAASTTRLVVGK